MIESTLENNIKTYIVEEIYSGMATGRAQDDYTLRRESGNFPELLRPTDGNIKLKAGKWTSLWLELFSENNLPVGKSNVNVVLKTADA